MEIVVDEFIINWHLSNVNNERETAESIMRLVKRKCHKLVFDIAYLNRIREKLSNIEKTWKRDAYVTQVLIKRFRTLLVDSTKVRVCEGGHISELEVFKDQADRLVIKSALGIKDEKKIVITTDSDLIQKAPVVRKYGIEIIQPNKAEALLESMTGT
ncbi:MAG: hypothetical protein JTT14_02745 [Candidatus Brockarchaeota archaeon]|nr:hypothetical protein [Candidatus Brockarchaeota archaeon]